MVSPNEGEPGTAVPAASRVSDRSQSFALLALGAFACCAALYLFVTQEMPPWGWTNGLIVLFGLPYVLRELGRRTNRMLVIYFVLLIPAFHYAAHYAAMIVALKWADDMPGGPIAGMFLAGSLGGLVGAGLSLLALRMPGLRVAGGGVPLSIAALAALTLLGGLSFIPLLSDLGSIAYTVYLPWQIVFAFFLSRLLPSSPPRRAAAGRVE
jgi:hypothetical protein